MINRLIYKVTSGLEENGIDYMISGSLALNHYVMPRMTMDIDLVVELGAGNISQFFAAFSDSDYYINRASVKEEVSRRGMFNLIDLESGIKIDFIVRKPGDYRKEEFARRVRKRLGKHKVWIVTAEDLIISKLDWIQQLESEKQKEDIRNLMAVDNIDVDYIRCWIDRLHLKTYGLIEEDE